MKFMRYLFVVVFVCLSLSSCATRSNGPDALETGPGPILNVDDSSMGQSVFDFPGWVVVMFYNDQYWQSKDMMERINFFANRYGSTVRFCQFYWDIKRDRTTYKLDMLPTTILYHHGKEIDRIMGIPEQAEKRDKWNNDINLWLLKNAFELEGDALSANYMYRFNNSSELEISNQ